MGEGWSARTAGSQDATLRIAYHVAAFPALSETFVTNQVAGLLARGHSVDVHSNLRPASEGSLPEHEAGRLSVRHAPRPPESPVALLPSALAVLAGALVRGPRGSVRAIASVLCGADKGMSRWALLSALARPERRRADAVLCHFGPNALLPVRLRRLGLLEGPILVAFHGFDMTRHLREHGPRAYDRLFREAELFLPISELWRERLEALGCPPERIRVHRMGVALADFPFTPKWPEPGEPLRLLGIGRLVEKKGFADALRALAALGGEGTTAGLRLVGDGPLRGELEALARDLGVADRVAFLGGQPPEAVRRLLAESHVLVAPSVTAADGDMEGLPVVLMEAMATGCLVVSTRHSGIPELVEDGVTGCLVDERQPRQLAERLRDLGGHPERWRPLLDRARARIESRHSVDRLNDRLVELFREAGELRRMGAGP